MTMFLPNSAVRPTGYEAGEFIDPDPLDRVRWEDSSTESGNTAESSAAALPPDHPGTTQEVF